MGYCLLSAETGPLRALCRACAIRVDSTIVSVRYRVLMLSFTYVRELTSAARIDRLAVSTSALFKLSECVMGLTHAEDRRGCHALSCEHTRRVASDYVEVT